MSDLFIRKFHPEHDLEALTRLDTSFTTDQAFVATSDGGSLHLFPAPVVGTRTKHYPIAIHEKHEHQGFVAIEGDTIRGFIAVDFEMWHVRMVIPHFYVDKPARRRGIGRQLMVRALAHGRHAGALTAWVETSNVNHPGIEAYTRMGFSICGFDTTFYTGTPADAEFAIFLARAV